MNRLFLLFFIFVTVKSFCLYQGNPASCELPRLGLFIPEERALSCKVGFQTNKVFSKKMFLDVTQTQGIFMVPSISSFANQGTITLNIIDRLEIFVTAGKMQISSRNALFDEASLQLEGTAGAVWSIGGRALILLWGNTALGGEASYLSSSSHLKSLTIGGESRSWTYNHQSYEEWQIQVALSQELSFFSFYAGGAYSYTELTLKLPAYKVHATYKNRHKLSMVVGASASLSRALFANIEGKWFGEKSLGGSLDVRF